MSRGNDHSTAKRWWQSIRVEIVLLVLLMTLPTILLGVAGTLYYQGILKQDIEDNQLGSAMTISALAPDYLQSSQLYLKSLADRILVIRAMENNDLVLLHSVAVYGNNSTRVRGIYFTDSNGKIIEGTSEVAGLIGADYYNHSYVSGVIKSGRPVIGDAEPGFDQRPMVPVGVPVVDANGTVLGVLVGIVDLEEYSQIMDESLAGRGQCAYLVNRTGHVMAHTNRSHAWMMTNFSSVPVVERVLGGGSGILEYENPVDRMLMIGAYAPVESFGWGVVVATPTEIAYRPVWGAAWIMAAMIGIFSVGAVLLGILVGNRIASPIASMSMAMKRVKESGDYRRLLPLERKDEVGDLARAFDDMVYTIRRNMAEQDASRREIEELARRQEASLAQLRESEARFRSYFESPLVGIAISSPDKQWLDLNDKACEILGYSREELLKMTWDMLTYPEDLSKNVELLDRVIAGEIDTYTLEKRFVRKDGSLVSTYLSAGCIRNPDRSVKYMLSIIQDITEEKRAEEALKDAKAQAELYLDLMGHDINNMNQIAIGFLEMALSTMDLSDDERELLDKPLRSIRNSSELISNVGKLQKAAGNQEFKMKRTDLCSVLGEVVRKSSDLPGRPITVNFECPPGSFVIANELLEDLFSNLIGNAIKHSDPGKPLTIDVRVSRQKEDDKDYYEISIEDNGPGIPDALKAKLFRRFERGQTKASGRGLGLYLVKTLAREFGGKVRVEDRVPGDSGQGAKFIVLLPVLAE
ncbi:PAS domain S-box protein [Methanocella arvoryzae]|nr:PAS domain S-box protein [Methanocella arvoryzae]